MSYSIFPDLPNTANFGGIINLKFCGAVGNGVANDTAALQLALDTVAVNGGAIYVPSGKYLLKSLTTNPCTFLNGNNVTVFGDGPSSNLFADDHGTSNDGINPKVMTSHMVQVSATSENILFKDLQFSGRNSPWGGVWPYDAACRAAIACPDGFTSSHDVTIQNVRFSNLFGFAVRTGGGGEYRWTIRDSTIFETTNGININGNETLYENCRALYCNGIECSGHRSRVIGVEFVGGAGASMGGAGVPVEDSQVVGCSFKDITHGSAILVGGSTRTIVACNSINGCPESNHGIVLQNEGTFGVQSGPLLVTSNFIKTTPGYHGIWVKEAAGSVIANNWIEALGDALLVQTTDVVAVGNKLKGSAHDLELTNADRFHFDFSNTMVNNDLSPGGTASNALLDFIGTGAPTVTVPNGSQWRRPDGVGPNLYVRENGAWAAK